jgi:hypothetical protein
MALFVDTDHSQKKKVLPDASGTIMLTSLADADASIGIVPVAAGRFNLNGGHVKAKNLTCSRQSVGSYRCTFGTARPDANYVVTAQVIKDPNVLMEDLNIHVANNSQQTTHFDVDIYERENPDITIESGLTLTSMLDANTPLVNSLFAPTSTSTFAAEVVFPTTVTTACTLFELGGGGYGTTIGFHDTNTFRLAFGSGAAPTPDPQRIFVDISPSVLPLDGQLHTLVWEIVLGSPPAGRIYVDNILVGETIGTGQTINTFAGGDTGGFISQLNADNPAYQFIRVGEPNIRWPYGFEGKLRQYQNQQVSVTMQNTKRDRPFYVVVHDF